MSLLAAAVLADQSINAYGVKGFGQGVAQASGSLKRLTLILRDGPCYVAPLLVSHVRCSSLKKRMLLAFL